MNFKLNHNFMRYFYFEVILEVREIIRERLDDILENDPFVSPSFIYDELKALFLDNVNTDEYIFFCQILDIDYDYIHEWLIDNYPTSSYFWDKFEIRQREYAYKHPEHMKKYNNYYNSPKSYKRIYKRNRN